ncbi:hypothetical protein PMAYCL1PPCAC_23948 [Pristionchus mayeri]|uniref:Uncharacterized protein n=1 Tax=Pristionchus mayeri TaxID=1317129 RepID=A0AAN5CZN3_9BILA|nr:hypothetical protein PMAYCL1PPCAC_23948 [Pristionchus mayeri]
MILQKSMKLLHLLEKEDYAAFAIDVQKLDFDEQNGLVCDLIQLLGGAFTSHSSPDLERALEVVCTMSTPECRLYPMVDQAIESKFENLTRIILEALARDFQSIDYSLQHWMQWDMVVKADREILKELDTSICCSLPNHLDVVDPTYSSSSFDGRLKLWLYLCDFIQSKYWMRGSVISRSYQSPRSFLEYLTRVDPLSPIVVADWIHPFVFSPNFACSELSDRLSDYLSSKNFLERHGYVRIIVNSLRYMSGLLTREDIDIDLSRMERLLTTLLPLLNHYELGEQRMKFVHAFRTLLLSFPLKYQPLFIKRLVRVIKDGCVKVDAEAQILSFFVDLYRQQLVVKGAINDVYSSYLAEFWTVIFIKYEDCSHASMFYQSIFLLAGLQARMFHRLDLLKDVKVNILTPLQQQLADYLQLRKLQERAVPGTTNIDISFPPVVEDDSLIRLHISHRVMKETFQLIHEALVKLK